MEVLGKVPLKLLKMLNKFGYPRLNGTAFALVVFKIFLGVIDMTRHLVNRNI